MPNFFAILAFYYTCNSAAMSGALAHEQVSFGSDLFDLVKTQFLTDEELAELDKLTPAERSLRIRKGYLRFKRWEAANPDIVASLKLRALGQAA